MTVIEGVYDFLNITSDCSRYIRVFELLIYLNIRACAAVLLKALYARNLSLLRVPFYFVAAAVCRVSVESLFRSSRNFKGG